MPKQLWAAAALQDGIPIKQKSLASNLQKWRTARSKSLFIAVWQFSAVGDHYLYICDVEQVYGNADEEALFSWNGYGKVAPAKQGE